LIRLIVILFLLLAGHVSSGQDNCGIIDYDKVRPAVPDEELRQRIEVFSKLAQEDINKEYARLDSLYKNGVDDRNMNSDTQKALVDTIRNRFQRFENYKKSIEQKLGQMTEEIDKICKQYIIDKSKAFCTDKGLHCLTDKKAILFCDNCIDYTDEFIKYIKQK
jgi:Skp family chaperone for outer membrane proteins